jgi:ankyrin repeat protein
MIIAKDGYTPLISTAKNGHLAVIEILINYGASVNVKGPVRE